MTFSFDTALTSSENVVEKEGEGIPKLVNEQVTTVEETAAATGATSEPAADTAVIKDEDVASPSKEELAAPADVAADQSPAAQNTEGGAAVCEQAPETFQFSPVMAYSDAMQMGCGESRPVADQTEEEETRRPGLCFC